MTDDRADLRNTRTSTGRPRASSIDAQIGAKLREFRLAVGLTQQQLATDVGLAYQQIHKYETGRDRISASVLWQLSLALDVSVDRFFDELPRQSKVGREKFSDALNDEAHFVALKYHRITDGELRRAVWLLVRAAAGM